MAVESAETMNLHHVAVPHHPTPQALEASGPPPRLSRQLPRLHHRGFHRNRPSSTPQPSPPASASSTSLLPKCPPSFTQKCTPSTPPLRHSYYKLIPIPPVHCVEPLIKEDELLTKVDSECLPWLDQQPPDSVIFIALGSGGTMTAEQLSEFAWGLELSQQRFIWLVRKPTNAGSWAAFFNVGGDLNDPKSYLPEGLFEGQWSRSCCHILDQSGGDPTASVTGGFLSHCGSRQN